MEKNKAINKAIEDLFDQEPPPPPKPRHPDRADNAFPVSDGTYTYPGMTIHDFYAGLAMIAIIRTGGTPYHGAHGINFAKVASDAMKQADAMMKAKQEQE